MRQERMPTVQLRLPQAYLDRVEDLVDTLERDPALAASGRATRSAVLRLAIHHGLVVLERKKARG